MPKRFKMQVNCDNAAFDGDDCRAELARILRAVADRLERGDSADRHRNAHDSNGNPVGTFILEETA